MPSLQQGFRIAFETHFEILGERDLSRRHKDTVTAHNTTAITQLKEKTLPKFT